MAVDTLKRLLVFVALCLTQALVFNHIHLLGYATILLYVYFVVMFPRNYPRWANLLWSFFMGLCIDMFTNTPGMTTASLTLVGFLQPYLLEAFVHLRLYALGLAGGMLGKAFNDIAAMTLGDGSFGIGWLAFAVILVIGHALNLAMCCLGAFVHPLRLNFLEFFKNSGYDGKGRTYQPIKK